jgi:hypothetical protein
MKGNSFCQQYPSCEKLKLFELIYTSGPFLLHSSLLFAYIALYRAECFIGQKIAPSYLFAITRILVQTMGARNRDGIEL